VGRGDPAVTPALYGLNKYGIVRGVPERVAKAVDGTADAVVEVNKDVLRPQGLAELVPAENLVRPAEQKFQSPKRKVLNLDLRAILPQFAGADVGLENTETDHVARLLDWLHRLRLRGAKV
jgi:hypothetical protein